MPQEKLRTRAPSRDTLSSARDLMRDHETTPCKVSAELRKATLVQLADIPASGNAELVVFDEDLCTSSSRALATMKNFLGFCLLFILSSACPYSIAIESPSAATLASVDHGVGFSLSLDYGYVAASTFRSLAR